MPPKDFIWSLKTRRFKFVCFFHSIKKKKHYQSKITAVKSGNYHRQLKSLTFLLEECVTARVPADTTTLALYVFYS